MTVALIIKAEGSGFRRAVAWASRLSRSRGVELIIAVRQLGSEKAGVTHGEVVEETDSDDPVMAKVRDALQAAGPGAPRFDSGTLEPGIRPSSAGDPGSSLHLGSPHLWRLTGDVSASAIIAMLKDHGVELLILARDDAPRSDRPQDALTVDLLQRATSATMILRIGAGDAQPADAASEVSKKAPHILVPVDLDPVSFHALRVALDITRGEGSRVTALLALEEAAEDPKRDASGPFNGDPIAVGERVLSRVIDALPAKDRARVRARVVQGPSPRAVIQQEGADADLILCGGHRVRWRQGRMRGSVSSFLLDQGEGPTVAVLRPPVAATYRLALWFGARLRATIPQMERDARVELVQRIQSSSTWNFDFIALVCLSTLIATFGLIQNSAAVVIGAMLVAPLMTPLVGAGLALVQSNPQLIRGAARTLVLGFLLAFALAAITGLLVPGLTITDQIAARARPGVLDLLVAGLSGIAAAYAMTRKELSAALPGVAIAAALVPPISCAGIGLAAGEYWVTAGALLLFVSNIVAIVLGSTWSLWLTGVRVAHAHGTAGLWIFNVLVPLVAVTVMLGSPMTARWIANGDANGDALASELEAPIRRELEATPGAEFGALRVIVEAEQIQVEVCIDATSLPEATFAARLREIAVEHSKDVRPVVIRLIPRIVIEAGPTGDAKK